MSATADYQWGERQKRMFSNSINQCPPRRISHWGKTREKRFITGSPVFIQ